MPPEVIKILEELEAQDLGYWDEDGEWCRKIAVDIEPKEETNASYNGGMGE